MQEVTKDREKWTGGSDIPVIMGLSPFKTRFELLKEKAGVEKSTFAGNEYTEYGNVMEPKIRAYMKGFTGYDFIEDEVFREEVRYHSDGASTECILEIKTTSQIHEHAREYKIYIVQLLTGMWVHGCENGILAVYERPDDFSEIFDDERLHIYKIEWADYQDWWEEICRARVAFMEDLAYMKENPFCSEEDLPSSGMLMVLTNQIIILEEKIVSMKAVEKEIEDLKSDLKRAMEKQGFKSWDFGKAKVTLVPDGVSKTVKVFDEKRFESDFPTTYQEYLVDKVKNGRRGYVKITVRAD